MCDQCEEENHHHLVCRVYTVSIVYDEGLVVTKIIPDTPEVNVFDECEKGSGMITMDERENTEPENVLTLDWLPERAWEDCCFLITAE